MGWLDRIKGKQRSAGGPDTNLEAAPPPDRVADVVNDLGSKGRFDEIEKELARFHLATLTPNEAISWHTMMIASAFRRGDRATAYERAVTASQALPDNPEIAFALGQELEFRGQIDEMVNCFRRAPFPKVSAHHTFAAVRYCYLRGRFADGLELMRPLLDAYFKLGIADDTFLYIRGMPFASSAFSTAACLHLLNGDAAGARSLVKRALSGLSDCDLSDFPPLIEAQDRREPAMAVTALESSRESHISDGPFNGFAALQIAVWKARILGTMAEVDAMLSRVTLSDKDFPWLHDVRTLACAEAHHRFNEAKKEEAALRGFIEKQPLLLEPEWLFKFGLTTYQERVRTSYWIPNRDRQ